MEENAAGFSGRHNKTTATGFEPVRAEPIGFQVQLLNLSDTLSNALLLFETGRQRGARPRKPRAGHTVERVVAFRNGATKGRPAKQNSGHPESNQGPFDICHIYSRTLYQLSYIRAREIAVQVRAIAPRRSLPIEQQGLRRI